MMKAQSFFIALLVLTAVSCGTTPAKRDPQARYFSGDFAGSPIVLSLKQLDDSAVKGESDHKGQHLEMSGKRRPSEKGYAYTMREIGQGRFSGVYEFEWDTSLNMIFGSWVSIDSTSRLGVMYTLTPDSTQ